MARLLPTRTRTRSRFTQRLFPFLERLRRRDSQFKRVNLALTALALIALAAGTSRGRYLSATLASDAKIAIAQLLDIPLGRSEVEARKRRDRAHGAESTRGIYQRFYDQKAPESLRRTLKEAGMAPADALYRPANYNRTVVLSSKVFAADETGRAYRMVADTRSFWTKSYVLPRGLDSFFFLPDTPGVREAMTASGAAVMPESPQSTNSWGCRGPEPDPQAEIRGLILGDSFMQGLFVADSETPPACLERDLAKARGKRVSLLNTGHIGYSPEQYYFTLLEYYDKFKPKFVVLSICPNDFGDAEDVLMGIGDWDEGAYWLGAIDYFCRTHELPCLLVPIPFESQVMFNRGAGHYPGKLLNIFPRSNTKYLDPIEAFVQENLRLKKEAWRAGKRPSFSPLFNGHIHDGHFSAAGCALWAREVARRLVMLIEP